MTLRPLGRTAEAMEMFNKMVAGMAETLGRKHPTTVSAKQALLQFQSQQSPTPAEEPNSYNADRTLR